MDKLSGDLPPASLLKRTSWRANAALACAAALVLLLTCEAGLRLARIGEPRPTGYAPVITDLRFGRPRNARGYRDLERSREKPPGVRRLLVLGDSFAWGAGIEFEDTWGQRLGRGLERRHGEPWEVVNLALPGLAATDYAAQLTAEGLAYAPDVIVVGYGLNDAESKQAMKERERGYGERDQRPPSRLDALAITRLLRQRFRAAADSRERLVYHRHLHDESNPGWVETRRALKSIGSLSRERGVPWLLAVFPMFGNPLDEHYPFAEIHAKVRAAAEQSGARVVDLLPAYAGLALRAARGERRAR